MTDLEKRARQMMIRDSGPEDLSWEDSPEYERRGFMLEAAEERARAYTMGQAMAYRQHGDSADETDIQWYSDLVLTGLIALDSAGMTYLLE